MTVENRYGKIIIPETASKVIKRAMSRGATFAEVFAEDKKTLVVGLSDSKIKRNVYGQVYGAGIRVFFGTQVFYGYTSDLSLDSLLEVATLLAGAWHLDTKTKPGALVAATHGDRHPVAENPIDVKAAEKIAFLRAMDDAARSSGALITQVDAAIGEIVQDVEIYNSEGLMTGDRRVYTRAYVSAVASKEGEKQTGHRNPGAHAGYEFIRNLDPGDLGRDAARQAITMLEAEYAPSGKMPVVIDNGFGGVIFHEACGHALESSSVSKNASIFAGKLGERIASECVSAVDDGTIVNGWGSTVIDDEGTLTERTLLIEKGILKSYMVDKLGGLKIGHRPTGSGRRESYRFSPTSRMRNTFILPGDHTIEEMISSVDKGLYASKMGGGSVSPATGEFNFSVQEGYLIENGRIGRPVRGATLVGHGAEILKNITMVGKTLDLAQGMCGSSSGSVPTCVGQPPVLVSQIVVGGR